jgi:mycothiol synthase
LQGLLFRRLNAPDDYARLVRVHRTSRTVDGFDPSSVLLWSPDSADGVARDVAALAEPAVDTVIAEAGGEVVGYANVRTWTERDDLAVYLPLVWLDPAWRGRGLEEALLAWGERRAERMAETRSPSGRRVYASNALGTQPALIAALEGSGYRLAFSLLEMVLARPSPVAESPVPDGYELRRPTSAGLRPVWEAIHAAYDVAGSVRPTPTEDEWRRFLDNPRSDTNLWRVAWCGEEVAGVVIGEAVADRGEITKVSGPGAPPPGTGAGAPRARAERLGRPRFLRGPAPRTGQQRTSAATLRKLRLPACRRAPELPQAVPDRRRVTGDAHHGGSAWLTRQAGRRVQSGRRRIHGPFPIVMHGPLPLPRDGQSTVLRWR